MPRATRDQKLAFAWHTIETGTVCFLGLLAVIGWVWSWQHLGKTSTEISQERANRQYTNREYEAIYKHWNDRSNGFR